MAAPDPEPRPRESGCAVLGVSGALLLFVLAAAGVWFAFPSERVDADAALAELFDVGPLPHGLELVEGGVAGRGKRVLRFVDPAAPPEDEPEPGDGDGDGDGERDEARDAGADGGRDGSGVEPAEPAGDRAPELAGPPPEDAPPREVLVLHFTSRGGRRAVAELFAAPSAAGGPRGGGGRGGGRGGPPGGGGPGGGGQVFVIERGTLPWAGGEAPYVHRREMQGPGKWRDVVRVDVSHGGRAAALVARWTRSYPASLERLEELLAALPPAAADS